MPYYLNVISYFMVFKIVDLVTQITLYKCGTPLAWGFMYPDRSFMVFRSHYCTCAYWVRLSSHSRSYN